MPAAADALTLAHRQRQRTISAGVAREILRAWGVIDPAAVDRTWPLVSRALTRIIARGYADSTAAAVTYLRAHAALYGVTLDSLTVAPPVNLDQLDTALRVTGPVAIKQGAALGRTAEDAARVALVRLVGSGTRLALLGGRATVDDTVARSDQIAGWRRVGDGHQCAFCDMLIGRGAVYKSAENAGSRQSFHDHCGCQTEPLYVGQDEPADVAAAFARYVATR